MSNYKKVFGAHKTFRYMSDKTGRWLWTKAENVPDHVKAALEPLEVGTIYVDAIFVGPVSAPNATISVGISKKCIFDGLPGTRQKYVVGQIVYLCEDDYQTKTTGEVGAKVKEVLYAQSEN